MIKRIGKKQVLKTLHELVDEFGVDYVYKSPDRFEDDPDGPTCFYTNADGTPSCAAGHVFFRLTPELYDGIRVVEDESHLSFSLGSSAWVEIPVQGETKRIGDYLTKAAIRILANMQERQDSGTAWGPALDRTEKVETL